MEEVVSIPEISLELKAENVDPPGRGFSMRFFRCFFLALLATYGTFAFEGLAYSQAITDPWLSAEPATYLYVSPGGSDANDGRTPLPSNTSGPKATIQGAINALLTRTPSPSKAVIVMAKGRYDLNSPVKIPPQLTSQTALKIRSEEQGVAVLTGARALFGDWSVSPQSPGLVKWDLGSSLPLDYQNFSTLYSHQGFILPPSRFPSYTGSTDSYLSTRGVPFLEYLRIKFQLSSQQITDLAERSSALPLEQVLADRYRQLLPGQIKSQAELRREAAEASGYSENELANGFTRPSISGAGPVTVSITLGDCLRQTFLIDSAVADGIARFDYSRADLVILPTFEASRTKLLRLRPFPFGATPLQIGMTSIPVRREFSGWLSSLGYRFYFENDRAMMSAPGSWYLDRTNKTLYYRLLPTQELRSDGKIYPLGSSEPIYFNLPSAAFKAAPLLTLGTPTNPAQYAIVEGIRFSYTDWEFPASGYYSGGQSYSQSNGANGPSLLFPALLAECNRCRFTSNTFSALAGHALTVNGTYSTINRNDVFEIGANGVTSGRSSDAAMPPGTIEGVLPNHHNSILGNHIASIGEIHPEGTGILVFKTTDSEIADNLLEDISYSGISLGWGWIGSVSDQKQMIDRSLVDIERAGRNVPLAFLEGVLSGRNNIIQRNIVRRVMSKLVDGAGIYIVGSQPGTRIEGNFVYDLARREQLIDLIYGIYFDRGTQFVQVRNNYIGNVGRAALMLNVVARLQITHNIFSDLINERAQGAFLSDMVSSPLGIWTADYLNQQCSLNASCTRNVPPTRGIQLLGHDNVFTKNIFLGTSASPFVVKAQSGLDIQEASVRNGGGQLFANRDIDWLKLSPYSPARAAEQIVGNQGALSLTLSGKDPGVLFSPLQPAVTIQSTSPAFSAPVSFGTFGSQPGPKQTVGAYKRTP